MASTVSASVAFSRAAVSSHTNVLSSRSAPAAEPARAVIRASGPKKAVLGKESRLLGGMSLEATAAKQRVQATPAAFSVVARKVDAAGKKVVIITGASSGLGLNAAKQLAKSGEWLVVMACRDYAKAEKAAKRMGMADGTYTIMHLDLASLNSVRDFVDNFRASGLPVDALVANAAVYLPLAKEPTFTADGYELSVATNHLGHFLLCNLMLEDLKKSKKNPRMVIVGSVTGNTNTLAGQIPPKADLGNLEGLDKGFKDPITMINGGKFDGAKAYKDSKVCNMLTMREFSRRFKDSGVTFSSLYPGCIADTQLFRNHNDFFRWSFPKLQQNLTKGYVSEEDAGKRLAAVVSDPSMGANGAYWSWKQSGDNLYANYNSKETGAFVNEPSQEVQDDNKGRRLWELSEKLVGLKTPVRA